MLIALTGNDGSGKTTLLEALATELAKERSVKTVPEFSYPVQNLLRKRTAGQHAQQAVRQQAAGKTNAPGLTIRLMPYLMVGESLLQTWFYRLTGRNTIIVKDRSVYDYLATWRELGVSNRFVELLYRLAPKPDLTFYVRVNPATSKARRSRQPEKDSGKDLRFYQLKRALYDKIYDHSRITAVDNNGSLEATLTQILFYYRLRCNLKKLKDIAISGLDGAGKSTTTAGLAEVLDRLNLKYASIHFYYNYIPLKPLAWVKKHLAGSKPTDEATQHKRSLETEEKHLQTGKSLFWKTLVLADARLQYHLARRWYWRRVIIFDRFFPDYLVSFDFLGVPYNQTKMLTAFPKPDMYFLQTADYQILHRRKPEHTLAFFKQCHDRYAELAKQTNMIILDSGKQDKDQVLKNLLEHIA